MILRKNGLDNEGWGAGFGKMLGVKKNLCSVKYSLFLPLKL